MRFKTYGAIFKISRKFIVYQNKRGKFAGNKKMAT